MGFRSKTVSIGVVQSDFSPTRTIDSYFDDIVFLRNSQTKMKNSERYVISQKYIYYPYPYTKEYKMQKRSLFNEFHEVSAKA